MKGMSKHQLRAVYYQMIYRCYDPTNKNIHRYGKRGITVCEEWIESKDAFYVWALPLWKDGLQIDRIDNDGNYEPSNCRFTTPKENSHNGCRFVPQPVRDLIKADYALGISISRIGRNRGVARPTIYGILKE